MDKETVIKAISQLSKEEKSDCIKEVLSQLTVLEMADLKKMLEESWGVSAAAAAPMMMAAPAGGGDDAASAEPTEFQVVYEGLADDKKKISVIKEIRALTGLGLKDASDFVKESSKAVKEGVAKAEADEVAKKLTDAGAKVTVKGM